MDIIQYLLSVIQYLYQQNCWLINFICRYIPLKQWAFDDSHSPKYQKFKVDELPKVQIIQHEWDWRLLIPYFDHRYGVKINPSPDVRNATSRKTAPALPAVPHSLIFTAITEKLDSYIAKYAIQTFHREKTASASNLPCAALTVARLSWRKKNGSISSFTSVSTQNAPTISTTLRKWTRPI